MRFALATALMLTLAGCSTVQPVPIASGDECVRCRRTIVEVRLAGEIVTTGSTALKFRTVTCMAKYLNEHPDGVKAVFVTDYTTGRMLSAVNARFVRATIDKATKERDYLAFRSLDAAIEAGAGTGATPVDWFKIRQLMEGTAN